MLLCKKKYYIIKKSDGSIWSFIYKENKGIVCRGLKENNWVDYKVIDNSRGNFSVSIIPNDNIHVIYEGKDGYINSNIYNGHEWIQHTIIGNNKMQLDSIYFKTVVYNKKIHIIYRAVDKSANSITIFHQILDLENNLSTYKIIDRIKFYYENPFTIYTEDDKGIFLLYCKLEDKHSIGYKVFTKENEEWSNFYIIDKSDNPYKDYSMIILRNTLHYMYAKEEDGVNTLIHCYGKNGNFAYDKILEKCKIDFCMLFIVYGQVWYSFIKNNKIYSAFSMNNGISFTTPPYVELINSPYIIKAVYKSNENNDIKYLGVNEIYITDLEATKCLVIPNIYYNINQENNYIDSSYIIYFIVKIHEVILLYKKNIEEKEKLIDEFKYFNGEIKSCNIPMRIKIHKRGRIYNKINKERDLLNENINFLQTNLITKEQKINLLENMNIEKENNILNLKNQIENLNKKIKELNLDINENKSKKTNFFKGIFNK